MHQLVNPSLLLKYHTVDPWAIYNNILIVLHLVKITANFACSFIVDVACSKSIGYSDFMYV